jgi:C4-dicarboxylate transporter, DctQ subunit
MSAPDPTRLGRLLALWDRIELTLVGLLGACAMVIAAVQVFGRYIAPEHAITWAEEVIVYIAVWAVMIVTSQLVRRDGHVRPDLVLRILPPWVQRWVEMFNCLVAIAFTAGMVWYGWDVVSTAVLLDQRSSSDLQFPIWIYYLSLPVGGGLMLLRYIGRLLRYALHFDPKTMAVGHVPAHETSGDFALPVTK